MKTKFEDILEAFDFVSYAPMYEHEAYLCRQTGKIYCDSEFADNFEELPEDIADDEKYVVIPHKNEMDLGSNLALKFIQEKSPGLTVEVDAMFQQKDIDAKFKALLQQQALIDQWYEFETQANEKALKEWCKENKVDIDV